MIFMNVFVLFVSISAVTSTLEISSQSMANSMIFCFNVNFQFYWPICNSAVGKNHRDKDSCTSKKNIKPLWVWGMVLWYINWIIVWPSHFNKVQGSIAQTFSRWNLSRWEQSNIFQEPERGLVALTPAPKTWNSVVLRGRLWFPDQWNTDLKHVQHGNDHRGHCRQLFIGSLDIPCFIVKNRVSLFQPQVPSITLL